MNQGSTKNFKAPLNPCIFCFVLFGISEESHSDPYVTKNYASVNPVEKWNSVLPSASFYIWISIYWTWESSVSCVSSVKYSPFLILFNIETPYSFLTTAVVATGSQAVHWKWLWWLITSYSSSSSYSTLNLQMPFCWRSPVPWSCHLNIHGLSLGWKYGYALRHCEKPHKIHSYTDTTLHWGIVVVPTKGATRKLRRQ